LNTAGLAGQLIAFEDRLVIVKVGGLTAMMAGATFGGRFTTIYFHDITGIEYNANMFTGVLEVSTPSYQASANKDYWRGSSQGRNSDSNDPFTLSNTLPLSKSEYRGALDQINELRARIARSKNPTVRVVTASLAQSQVAPGVSLAAELRELGELLGSGVISQSEFEQAKARVLARKTR